MQWSPVVENLCWCSVRGIVFVVCVVGCCGLLGNGVQNEGCAAGEGAGRRRTATVDATAITLYFGLSEFDGASGVREEQAEWV